MAGKGKRTHGYRAFIVGNYGCCQCVGCEKNLTPELRTDCGETCLLLIDLGKGANLLGASVLAQTHNQLGDRPPDLDDPLLLRNFFHAIQTLNRQNLLLAYHDRSDGGLLVTVCEMLFASRVGANVNLDGLGDDPIAALFSEELGAVIQIKAADISLVLSVLSEHKLQNYTHKIGELNQQDALVLTNKNQVFITLRA